MIRGKHDIKVGGGIRINQMNVRAEGLQDGFWIVSGDWTGSSMADMVGQSERSRSRASRGQNLILWPTDWSFGGSVSFWRSSRHSESDFIEQTTRPSWKAVATNATPAPDWTYCGFEVGTG